MSFLKIAGDGMIGKIIAALLLPGILVVLFTRVTYNEYVGLLLTVALIAVSAYSGYTDSWLIIILDAVSVTVGFWYSRRMAVKYKKRSS